MPLSIDLKNCGALVTGVTSGIGAGIAEELARAGCDVTGCGLEKPTDDAVKRFQSSVGARGSKAHYLPCDLQKPDAPGELVKFAAKAMGGLDIVVSCAGRNVFEGVDECAEKEWRDSLELNLASHWRLAKAARPWLEKAKAPVFIVINSNQAFRTLAGCFPYNVAKAGLLALVQSLAIEWGPQIRAVGIAPGFIDTPGNDSWFNGFPDPAAERRRTEALHPVGRIGTPREIGGLCAFLASSYAGFISGVTLPIDGGRSALLQDSSNI